jgi:hypothetical protein
MFIYTIFNFILLHIIGFLLFVVSILNSIVNIPTYIKKIKDHYNLITELQERTDVLMKEIVCLHKMHFEIDEILIEIASTMKFTGAEWQHKIIKKKLERVLKHHFQNVEDDWNEEEEEKDESNDKPEI